MFQGFIYSPSLSGPVSTCPWDTKTPSLTLQRWGVNCVLSQILGGKGKPSNSRWKRPSMLQTLSRFHGFCFLKWDDSVDVCICVYRGWSAHPRNTKLRDQQRLRLTLFHRFKRQKTLAVAAWFFLPDPSHPRPGPNHKMFDYNMGAKSRVSWPDADCDCGWQRLWSACC